MADGIGQGIGQAIGAVAEAVVKPVADELGKAIEEGAQTIVSGPPAQSSPTDQSSGDKQKNDQEKIAKINQYVSWQTKLEEEIEKVRKEKEQKILSQKQEDQQKMEVKQSEDLQKKQSESVSIALKREQTKSERRGGSGVGG